jgi:hypothetical protein
MAGPMMATAPLGRLVAPDAIARAAVFLASDDATDVHGTVLDVDGGRSSVLSRPVDQAHRKGCGDETAHYRGRRPGDPRGWARGRDPGRHPHAHGHQQSQLFAAQAVTRSLLLRWRSDLATGLRAMQMDGTAPAALDPDRFAGAIVAGIQGGVAILLTTGSSADLEAVLDLLLEQLGTPEEVAGSTDPVLTRRLVGVHIDDLR